MRIKWGLLVWVAAATLAATSALAVGDVVIGEFRTRGPAGGNDEFIELFNRSAGTVDISGWKINGSNNSGTTGTRVTIGASTILAEGQHFLAVNNASGGYSGTVAGDQTYNTGITDTGGIALLMADNTVVDQVGMHTGSAYKEGTVLTPMAGASDQSYQRLQGECQDTDDNSVDYALISPSQPENLGSTLAPCGGPTSTPTNTPAGSSTPTPAPTSTPTTGPTATPAPCNDLLADGGFESWTGGVLDQWLIDPSPTPVLAQETTIVHGGTSSVSISTTSTSNVGVYQDIPVVGGSSYELRGYLYPVTLAEGGMGIVVSWYDGMGAFISSISTVYASTVDTWNYVTTGVITAPATAALAKTRIRGYATGPVLCGYADDFEFCGTLGPTPTPTVEPTATATPTFGPSATPTTVPSVLPGDVLINEVMYDSFSSADVEWVEIYNNTLDAIDISGWCLTDAPEWPWIQGTSIEGYLQVPPGTTIEADDYLILSKVDLSVYYPCAVLCTEFGSHIYGNSGDNLALFTGNDAFAIMVDGSLTVQYPDLAPTNLGYSIEKDVQTDPWPASPPAGWHFSTNYDPLPVATPEFVYHTGCLANSAPATPTPEPSGSPSATPTSQPTSTPTSGTPTPCNDILVDGGLEAWTAGALDNWYLEPSVTVEQDTITVHGGTSSAHIVTLTNDNRGITQDVPVVAGQSYSFSGWVFGNVSGAIGIGITWYTADYATYVSTSNTYNAGTGAWELVSTGDLTAPPDTVIARVRIRGYANVADCGWVDDFQFCGAAGTAPSPTPTPIPQEIPATGPAGLVLLGLGLSAALTLARRRK